MSSAEAADLFRDAPVRWWISGGWSAELAAVPHPFHEELEAAIARDDVPAVRDWLRDYHLWDTHGGARRLLSSDITVPIRDPLPAARRDAPVQVARLPPRDAEDFAAVLAGRNSIDRVWDRDAIALTESATHPWIERLR